eukprot:1000476_1
MYHITHNTLNCRLFYRLRSTKLVLLSLFICFIIRHFRKHHIYYSGLMDFLRFFAISTVKLQISHSKFTKTVITSKDSEQYSIWIPKGMKASPTKHIWVYIPGGFMDIDGAIFPLYEMGLFEGSEVVCFNNPG